jgi:xanthine dehydrogenase YagR molybdenum-binding subunit
MHLLRKYFFLLFISVLICLPFTSFKSAYQTAQEALTEESIIDPRYGNFATRSFADYHVPSNLDVGKLDAMFINEEDKIANTLGVKGIGEVGIVGVAGAIANAVFNATGKRIRNLPITPDKLL